MSVVGTIRPVDVGFTPKRLRDPERASCGVHGCVEPTTGRKPYCIEHLDRLPYVQWLKGELARRDADADAIARHRAIDPEGPLAREIRGQLALHGSMTYGRLSRELLISVTEIGSYVRALERAGVVETSVLRDRQGRVRPLVSLVGTPSYRAA
jgi:hypothetical protein